MVVNESLFVLNFSGSESGVVAVRELSEKTLIREYCASYASYLWKLSFIILVCLLVQWVMEWWHIHDKKNVTVAWFLHAAGFFVELFTLFLVITLLLVYF